MTTVAGRERWENLAWGFHCLSPEVTHIPLESHHLPPPKCKDTEVPSPTCREVEQGQTLVNTVMLFTATNFCTEVPTGLPLLPRC